METSAFGPGKERRSPLPRVLLIHMTPPGRFEHAYGIQVPGLSGPRTGERAEPHVRLRPGRLEPHPGLAPSTVTATSTPRTSYAQASAYLTAMKAKRGPGWLNEVSCVPLQQAVRHQQAAFAGVLRRPRPLPPVQVPRAAGSPPSTPAPGSATGTGSCSSPRRHAAGLHLVVAGHRPGVARPDHGDGLPRPGRPLVRLLRRRHRPTRSRCPQAGRAAGVDLGIKDFAVTSDGEKIANPRHLERKARNLARYQRRLARCQKGAANRAKARAKVARAHRKVRARGADFLHKTSTRLVREPRRDRDRGPRRQEHGPQPVLAKAISDCGWGAFRRMLEYKADRAGRRLIVIDRFYPSPRPARRAGTCSPD